MGLGAPATPTGYTYSGSFAVAVGIGPMKTLFSVKNGDTEIWTGPIDISSADGDGKTTLTTTIGLIDFYWGTATQVVSDLLAGLTLDLGSGPEIVPMPAYRNVCYGVCYQLQFGGQTTPPTLTFHVERLSSGLSLSAHTINGDTVLPEAAYDMLTNPLYGAGLTAAEVPVDSFVAAAEITITEANGASPDLDANESARDILGKVLSYLDSFLYLDGGKIKLKLNRVDLSAVPTLDEFDFLDEPSPRNTQFDDTWNKTIVTFRDRSNKWEVATEAYYDAANATIVGQVVVKTFDFPWITQRSVARQVAKRLGIVGGYPNLFWDLVLKPSFKTIKPGDRFRITYPKFSVLNRLVIVKEVVRGKPTAPEVKVTVLEDKTRDFTNDFLPAPDTFEVPATVGDDGTGNFALVSTVPRLSWLPADLKGTELDGMLVAAERPSAMTNGGSVYWTFNPGVIEYRLLANFRNFPAKATLQRWHLVRTTNWLLRIELLHAWDYDWLQTLHDEAVQMYCVVGRRNWKTVGTPKNEHEVLAPWLTVVNGGIFDLISPTIIEIEVSGEAFGTDNLSLETLMDDSVSPTLHLYFGRREDFMVYANSGIVFERAGGNSLTDAAEVRYVKVPMSNHTGREDVTGVTATQFDRDDTTMSPDGTLSTEWGSRAKTAYEICDEQIALLALGLPAPDYGIIAELDADLGAIYLGTATADQILRAESVDAVLGNMLATGQLFYNL